MPAPAAVPRWRWGVVWLLFAATLLNYTDRLALTGAQQFVLAEFAEPGKPQRDALADLNFAFGVAFGLGQVAAGFLVDRFSLRRLYVFAILAWSAAGILTGTVPAGMFGALIVCRIGLGLGEAFNWPCAVACVRRTIPRDSRGLANGVFHGGASVGAVLTPFLILGLIDQTTGAGWRSVFVLVGALGGVWAVAWLWLTRGERGALIDSSAADAPDGPREPLLGVLVGPLFWVCLVALCGVNLCWHLFNMWLPRHLGTDLAVRSAPVQYLMAGFFVCADVGSVLAGWVTRSLARSGFRVGRARQLVMTGLALTTATAGAAGGLLMPDQFALKIVAFYVVGAAALGGFSVAFALVQDVAPRHTAQVLGLCGCASWLLISLANQVIRADPGAGVPAWLFPLAGAAPLLAAAAGWCWPVRATDGDAATGQ